MKWSVAPKELQVSADPSGGTLAAWIIQDDSGSWVGVQRIESNGSLPWGPLGVRLHTSAVAKKDLRLLSDHRGGAVLAWREEDAGQTRLWLQELTHQGRPLWSDSALLIASPTVSTSALALDVDSKNRIFLVWEELQQDNALVRCQVIDENGRLKWPGEGRAVARADIALRTPAVAADQDGGFFVLWQSSDPANAALMGQYIDSKARVVWNPLGKVVTTGSSHPAIQYAFYTTDHELLVVWSEQNQAGDTWGAQSLDAGGRPRWGPEGLSLNPQEGELENAAVSIDSSGKITMAWEDAGTSPHKVFAQQWDRKGLPLWDSSGAPVVDSRSGDQLEPFVTSAGGEVYVLWLDSYDRPWEMYAQRMKGNGDFVWDSGRVVTPMGKSMNHPMGCSDFGGGVIALWEEPEGDLGVRLLALRISGSGAAAW